MSSLFFFFLKSLTSNAVLVFRGLCNCGGYRFLSRPGHLSSWIMNFLKMGIYHYQELWDEKRNIRKKPKKTKNKQTKIHTHARTHTHTHRHTTKIKKNTRKKINANFCSTACNNNKKKKKRKKWITLHTHVLLVTITSESSDRTPWSLFGWSEFFKNM